MTGEQSPDLLVLLTSVLALAFSPSLAAVLAPYLLVILGALLGVAWGLKRRKPSTRAAVWAFVGLMMATALVFTVPAAVFLQRYTGPGSYQWFLAPLAALIGAIGDDWPRVGTAAMEAGGRIIRRNFGGE